MTNYKWNRFKNDRAQYKRYWNMLKAGVSLIALFLAGLTILGAGIAIL